MNNDDHPTVIDDKMHRKMCTFFVRYRLFAVVDTN